MALDQLKKDLTELHGKLVDIVEEIEKLGEKVPENQFDPIITSNLASRFNGVVDHIDHALNGIVDTVEFTHGIGSQSSTSDDPDEAYKQTIGTVAQKSNTPAPIDPREKLEVRPTDPNATLASDNNSTQTVLVDKKDAANNIPSPTAQEGQIIDPVERQEPDQAPSTDKAGDVAVTIKPEAEPVRPEADTSDINKDNKVQTNIDVTAPNPEGVIDAHAPVPDANVPDPTIEAPVEQSAVATDTPTTT